MRGYGELVGGNGPSSVPRVLAKTPWDSYALKLTSITACILTVAATLYDKCFAHLLRFIL